MEGTRRLHHGEPRNGTLCTGVTSNLYTRIWQHKSGSIGFTSRYGCKLLVWCELHGDMTSAKTSPA